jgi:ATP-binding cassette subfamily F protein 3
MTQLSRLEQERRGAADEVALLTRRTRRLGFEFLKPPRSGRTVVEASGLDVAIGGRTLVDGASFALERGEHVGLVGPNGSGKTTLLETVLGSREPASGTVRIGHGVVPAYFSQHELELDTRGTVLQCVQAMTGLQRPDAQKLLGQFLFSGWSEHEKPVTVLSGGERRRLALAVVVAGGANFLVLDEPTNHLDLESREALEDALTQFPGSLLLVSHDRALLDAVETRTLAIEDGKLRSYEGSWAEYVQAREARRAVETAEPASGPKRAAPSGTKARSRRSAGPKGDAAQAQPPAPNGRARPSKNAQRAQRALERELEAAEAALRALEDELADPSAWSDPERSAASSARHAKAKREVEELYARWEAVVG